jgi:hypothetical protein
VTRNVIENYVFRLDHSKLHTYAGLSTLSKVEGYFEKVGGKNLDRGSGAA